MTAARAKAWNLAAELKELARLPMTAGCTLLEIQEAMGVSDITARKKLKVLISRGLVEAVRIRRPDVLGRDNWTAIYRVKQGGK